MTEQQGHYLKYIISKTDGSPVDPNADYFVLRLDKPENLYERRALWHYADCIAEENPQLHADIKNRITAHEYRIAQEEELNQADEPEQDWDTIENWLDERDEDDPEPEFDCGFVPGHGCQLAGTEDCDFDCPYRDRLIASPYYPDCDLFGHEANNPDEE